MARWEPDSRGRLEEAALSLYGERGFENTTVAEIAERAGVTERTFFRHFADKREVLFGGTGALLDLLVGQVADAAPSATPIEAVVAALQSGGALIQGRRDYARQRQAIIAASAELRERELIKLAALSVALAEALRQRGVDESTATLVADVGITLFRTGFERWLEDPQHLDLPQLIGEALGSLRAVTGS